MQWTVLNQGAFSSLQVSNMKCGECVKAESDSLVSMAQDIVIDSRMDGGILAGMGRRFLTGESFFLQTMTATRDSDDGVLLAPQYPASIDILRLDGEKEFFLRAGVFLAAEPQVSITSTIQSDIWKGVLSGSGFFVLKASGFGPVGICAFGSMHRFSLAPGEVRMVDNGHLIAWSVGMQFSMTMATNSVISSITSGEGIMCRFMGPGEVIIQSHSQQAFLDWISPQESNNQPPARVNAPLITFIVLFVFLAGVFGIFYIILSSYFDRDNLFDDVERSL